MTADAPNTHPYEPAAQHESEAMRRHYWAVAIGLQEVDGLEVSEYLKDSAKSYIHGEQSLDDVGNLVRAYHNESNDSKHLQADLVSQRITELLAKGAFVLAPEFLTQIHRYLFQDLDVAVFHPGEFKSARMIKQESILNGDSVLYADPSTYEMSLRAIFSEEQSKCYNTLDNNELDSFCRAIALLWQVHPFYEGNTRTVAVFSELYLNYLGFSLTNEPFASNAAFFRDALVRAVYRNAQASIFPDRSHLTRFYENALGRANHKLDYELLLCPVLFDNPSLLRNINPKEAFAASRLETEE